MKRFRSICSLTLPLATLMFALEFQTFAQSKGNLTNFSKQDFQTPDKPVPPHVPLVFPGPNSNSPVKKTSDIIQLPTAPEGQNTPFQAPAARIIPTQDGILEQVIQNQLTDIRNQDYSKAYYAYMSTDFQKAFNVDVFKAFVRKSPSLFRNKNFILDKVSFSDVIATVKGTLVSSDNQNARVEYDLIQEDGTWKIRKINLVQLNAPTAQKKLSRPTPN